MSSPKKKKIQLLKRLSEENTQEITETNGNDPGEEKPPVSVPLRALSKSTRKVKRKTKSSKK